MNITLTDISVVLDRSGSMSSVARDTIGGFNTFLAEQKKQPGQALLSLAQFDDHYEIIHTGKPIAEVPELTSMTFIPRGSTALLDAIGLTISRAGERLAAMPEAERPGKVIVVILTDGGENTSSKYTRDQINEMITHQRTVYNWEFVFLGANQDAIATAATYGIARSAALTYAANNVGTQAVFASASNYVTATRGMAAGGVAASFSDEDREDQKHAGATY